MNRNKAWKRGAMSQGATLVIVVVLLIGAFYAYQQGYFAPKQSSVQPQTTPYQTTNSQGQIVQSSYYIGTSWQSSPGGPTVSAVYQERFANVAAGTGYWNSGAMTSSTQYPTTLSTSPSYSLTNGWQGVIFSTDAANAVGMYSVGGVSSGLGTETISGFPGYSASVNLAELTTNNAYYIQIIKTIPGTYVNGSTSVTAVNLNVTQGFAGTKMPSSGFITINLVGVSARGGGIGMDQCANTQILAGVPNENVPVYGPNGASSVATAGTVVSANCHLIIQVNQTLWTPSNMNTIVSRQQVAGTIAYDLPIPAADIFQSSASSIPSYLFMSVTVPFTYSGPTGKDIAMSVAVVDNQITNNIINNFVGNSGLTGSSAACTSSTTTNMCINVTDMVVGTPQYTFGMPAAWGGGGHASSTLPSWLTQKSTALYPGWNYFLPCMTLQSYSEVFST